MPTRRIFYFCTDTAVPSGGIKVLYRHVFQLNRMGFDAAIVHTASGFSLAWHGFKVPVVYLQDKPRFTSDDICVVPEGLTDYLKQALRLGCTVVVIPLSWDSIYKCLPPGEDWRGYGIKHIFTPSPVIKQFVEWSMGVPVTLIDEYIDTQKFAYRPERKQRKIAYMSRKSPTGDLLKRILQQKGGTIDGYQWMGLYDLSEDQYAGQLIESRIYLPITSREGANISILEAMAAGCLVVGFAGVGGSAYMVADGDGQNCFRVENEDLPALGRALEGVVDGLEGDPHAFDRVIRNAVQTASRFGDFEREAECLKRCFAPLALR